MLLKLTFWRSFDLLFYWLPPVGLGIAILAMSGDLGSTPNSQILLRWILSWFPPIIPAQFWAIHGYVRKVGHAVAYGTLYFLWFRAFRGHLRHGAGRAFFWSLGVCLLVAMADEGHQYFVTSRTGEIQDVVLDLCGAMLAALLTFSLWTPRPLREPTAGL